MCVCVCVCVCVPQIGLNFVPSVFIIKTWNMAAKNIEYLFDIYDFNYHLNSSGICLELLM
jgi:hypothetical protein